eukprot:TRINITY_DN22030_c0_g1_i1.p1 TRINITY_DN22030_c0_g1~~TRINITY_DN22030_c0_g1_i1.p1  ORF type:complete len:234 (-),score=15.38 TRINITY_DN22030_c0_g1_i1:288-914(-)
MERSLRDILSLAPPPPWPSEAVVSSAPTVGNRQADIHSSQTVGETRAWPLEDSEDEPAAVLLGMVDMAAGWAYESNQWTPRPTHAAARELRLSDFMALPTDSSGKRMSVGSLGCLVGGRIGCRPCVFNSKPRVGGRPCQSGPSCSFCHVASCHTLTRRLARSRKKQRMQFGPAAQTVATVSLPLAAASLASPTIPSSSWQDPEAPAGG